MVRLVFLPYTQIWRSICTSELLRDSTRVPPGFTLFRNISPSFGSQHVCSHSDLSTKGSWLVDVAPCRSRLFHFHFALGFFTYCNKKAKCISYCHEYIHMKFMCTGFHTLHCICNNYEINIPTLGWSHHHCNPCLQTWSRGAMMVIIIIMGPKLIGGGIKQRM